MIQLNKSNLKTEKQDAKLGIGSYYYDKLCDVFTFNMQMLTFITKINVKFGNSARNDHL